MRYVLVSGILLIAIVLLIFYKQGTKQNTRVNHRMKIASTAFEHNQTIPAQYTCDGQNVNPPLLFSDVPKEAKSLVLIVDDPDAPAKTWVHWTVFNIGPQVSDVKENSVPTGGTEAMTDFGKPGYGGPCPPSGVHRYFFKLYALDSLLNLTALSTKQDIEKAMDGHILDTTEIIGLYSR